MSDLKNVDMLITKVGNPKITITKDEIIIEAESIKIDAKVTIV